MFENSIFFYRSVTSSIPPCFFFTLTTVNRIKEQYKVLVRIPQDSERSGLVRIEGDPKGVQLARRELIEMVQRMVRIWSKFRLVHSFIQNVGINKALYTDSKVACSHFPISRRTSAPKT